MLWLQCETADEWLQCVTTFTTSLVTHGFDAWLTSMGEVSTDDLLIFKNTCTRGTLRSAIGYLEFASLFKAFRFLDQRPILRLSKACRPALGIGGEEGVFPRMWDELTQGATTHFDLVIDMMNGERIDGWIVETGKPIVETGKLRGIAERRSVRERDGSTGETENPEGETENPEGETENSPEDASAGSVETWKAIEETSVVLLESMQQRLKATKEANWRWIEFL